MMSLRVSVQAASLVSLCASCAFFKPATFTPGDGDIPEGTMMVVRLEAPLTSRFSHLNEPIRARTVEEVQTEAGLVVIPRGTLFTGRVHDRIGDRIWIRLDTAKMEGTPQHVRARFIGSENGFQGRLHAGDQLIVRLDRPMWSSVAIQERNARTH